MAKDPAILAHQEWLGYVQPSGLVVSIPAMIEARVYVNRNISPDHQRFLSALPTDRDGEPVPEIANFPEFARSVFGWAPEDLYGAPGASALPETLEAPLPAYGETLRPTYALHDFQPTDPAREWILLIEVLPGETDLDSVAALEARRWQASPQARFERLLRETGIGIGLLVNGRQIRLVYAPRIESSGYITFNLSDMVKVAGRPIFAALHELLYSDRMFGDPKERLPAILENSRKYQNVVSTQLAGQVLEALYELLRGFQAADDQLHGELLRDILARDPNLVYGGLLTTLLRLVFLMYAEDRGLLSNDSVYANYYSVTGLYERLRADAGRYPDTMYQRYGAWAQLLALFRLVYEGGSHGGMRIPPREGYLFDPDRYPFLEGRRQRTDEPAIPRVSDGVLYHVLSKLMVLDGERLSYRTLAVEQIGSVYETIMGFDLQVAAGRSIAIKPAKKHGAPATVNLEGLLAIAPDKRHKWMADNTDQKLTGAVADALKAAKNIDDLLMALERRIARAVTPNVVPTGAMIFQPSGERRRSGSHYTPSTLTRPIVEAALKPVLRQLGDKPTPEQILGLKVCDPAMGSGAFLVEACRQLGDALAQAWHDHDAVPVLPPDEDEVLHAQRQIAQRCLYGVDKNPLAADLAKLSLWLATLAKDHPFTFLDHSLRAGDSLAGLTQRQIAAFHWLPAEQQTFLEKEARRRVDRVSEARRRILAAADDTPYATLQQKLDMAEQELYWLRLAGDAVLAAFFSADKPKPREEARKQLRLEMESALRNLSNFELAEPIKRAVAGLRRGAKGVMPFHWELEFPEVFTVDAKGNVTGGFDAIVGNPPFAGKNTMSSGHTDGYLDWLKVLHEQSHGNSDLVAHFFRRAFALLRPDGCFGLIATNTIGQGDTRSTGLRWICIHGGTICKARKRLKWPGQAAVVVSVVHVVKGAVPGPYLLDNREVPVITAYLFHAGGHEDPARLKANDSKSFQGVVVLGMGFTFDDTDKNGVASPIAEMHRLRERDTRNAERIFPYIGGEEVNDSPTHAFHRYVINFEDFPLRRDALGMSWTGADEEQHKAWLRSHIVPLDYPFPVAADWPDLLDIVNAKVRPDRLQQASIVNPARWWMFARPGTDLLNAIRGLPRVLLTNAQATPHLSFVFYTPNCVFANSLNVFSLASWESFCILQSRVHEIWAWFFSSSLEDRLRYNPTDCFETYPLPRHFESNAALGEIGRAYYERRAAIMRRYDRGLTTLYNWFHEQDPEQPEIAELRHLHDAMDHAVLDAYGWTDIPTRCVSITEFDDEEDEDGYGHPRRKKFRYRWPDEIRDEVLARLLELNRQRALEEGQLPTESLAFARPADPEPKTRGSKKKAGKRASEDFNLSLLPQEKEEA
jgi:hypothetical protein